MEKLPKKYVQCTISVFPLSFPFLFTIKFGVALLHTLKWNHFCLHFLFWFWLTLVNTDCGDYNFVVVVVPFMPVKADQVLGLTEGKDPVASLNLGVNKEEWCFYIPCPCLHIERHSFIVEQTFEKSNRMPPWNRLHYRTPEIGAPKSSMIILRNWKKRFRL